MANQIKAPENPKKTTNKMENRTKVGDRTHPNKAEVKGVFLERYCVWGTVCLLAHLNHTYRHNSTGFTQRGNNKLAHHSTACTDKGIQTVNTHSESARIMGQIVQVECCPTTLTGNNLPLDAEKKTAGVLYHHHHTCISLSIHPYQYVLCVSDRGFSTTRHTHNGQERHIQYRQYNKHKHT